MAGKVVPFPGTSPPAEGEPKDENLNDRVAMVNALQTAAQAVDAGEVVSLVILYTRADDWGAYIAKTDTFDIGGLLAATSHLQHNLNLMAGEDDDD